MVRVPSVSFTLLPAVDVADARAVRLVQGDVGSVTTSGDPLEAALAWQASGAEWIHLVDLDAAFGHGSNAELLASVIGKLDVKVELSGCARYVVTDVSKDGMLRGPNVELYRAVTGATATPVIASGGVSTIGDLVGLAEAAAAGANLEGAIVGKALYAGRFTLAEALEAIRRLKVTARARCP